VKIPLLNDLERYYRRDIQKFINNVLPYGIVCKMNAKKEALKTSKINTITIQSSDTPKIYNSENKLMNIFFIKDDVFAHVPYAVSGSGRFPKNILWDRFNFNLNTHFYTNSNVLNTAGSPDKRYAWFIESETIAPNDFKIFKERRGVNKDFDLIFTHSEKMLDKYENARFVPGSGVWFGGIGGGQMKEDAYMHKTKNISMVSSDKTMCELHSVRINLAHKLKQNNNVDLMGTFAGGPFINIADSLTNYRYSIVMENNITSVYFTEKIMNCFASMTIPVYLGATKIDKFFNPNGIIQFGLSDIDNIDKILNQCTEEDYINRLNAMKDNYNRVQKYLTLEDYIYDNYLKT